MASNVSSLMQNIPLTTTAHETDTGCLGPSLTAYNYVYYYICSYRTFIVRQTKKTLFTYCTVCIYLHFNKHLTHTHSSSN